MYCLGDNHNYLSLMGRTRTPTVRLLASSASIASAASAASLLGVGVSIFTRLKHSGVMDEELPVKRFGVE